MIAAPKTQIDPETANDQLHIRLAYAFSGVFLFSLTNVIAEKLNSPSVLNVALSVATIAMGVWAIYLLLRAARLSKQAGGAFIETVGTDERIAQIGNKAFSHGFGAVMIFNTALLVLPFLGQLTHDFGPFFTIGLGIVVSFISYNLQNR